MPKPVKETSQSALILLPLSNHHLKSIVKTVDHDPYVHTENGCGYGFMHVWGQGETLWQKMVLIAFLSKNQLNSVNPIYK